MKLTEFVKTNISLLKTFKFSTESFDVNKFNIPTIYLIYICDVCVYACV